MTKADIHPCAEIAIRIPIAIMQIACTKKNANRMPATVLQQETVIMASNMFGRIYPSLPPYFVW
jgi:hypothetical protein